MIKTLKEFQYVDEDGKDQGTNVRQKAKDITNLLQDEGRLREERRSRASMRDRMIRGANGGAGDDDEDENSHRRDGHKKPSRDEDELRKAIEESKRSLAKETRDREEEQLQEVLRLSKEEEDRRQKDVENSNASALFDDANQLSVFFIYQSHSFDLWFPIAPRQLRATAITNSRSSIPPHTASVCSLNSRFNPSSPQWHLNSHRLILINNRQNRRPLKLNIFANNKCSCFNSSSSRPSNSNSSNSSSRMNGCVSNNLCKCNNHHNSKICSFLNPLCKLSQLAWGK